MIPVERAGTERRVRRRYSVAEKKRIVELTFAPGASVAQVAQANGLNANQVFTWRRAFERGELAGCAPASTALVPVVVSASGEAGSEAEQRAVEEASRPAGVIHIEFPGRAMISVESGADAALLRSILESLRK